MFEVKFCRKHSIKLGEKSFKLHDTGFKTRKEAVANSKMLKKYGIPEKDYKFIYNKTGKEITL